MSDRQTQLLRLIEQATGRAAYPGDVVDEGLDVEDDDDTTEAAQTVT